MQDKINSSELNTPALEEGNYDTGPFKSFRIGQGYRPSRLNEKELEKQNLLIPPSLENYDCPRGEHGEEYCVTVLNLENNSTISILNQLGHASNQNKTSNDNKLIPQSEASADLKKRQNKSEFPTLTELRQRQLKLGLMDSQGNLFDPSTQKWFSAAFMPLSQVAHIQQLFDLDYFERYPEMVNGLPQNSLQGQDNNSNESLSFRI